VDEDPPVSPGQARHSGHQERSMSGQQPGLLQNTFARRPVPGLWVTIPDDEVVGREQGVEAGKAEKEEGRRRVCFNEEMRMHSIGGSQYFGKVVDKDGHVESER
jgi:hypothetical protein